MAERIDHSNCKHARTPAGRAACRAKRDVGEITEGFKVVQLKRQLEEAEEVTRQKFEEAQESADRLLGVSEKPADAPKRARSRRDMQNMPAAPRDVDKALDGAPARVRTVVNVAKAKGYRTQVNGVARGVSIHILSDKGAITVTWDGDEIAWFARRGMSSLSQRIKFQQVWEVLEK